MIVDADSMIGVIGSAGMVESRGSNDNGGADGSGSNSTD